MTPCYILKRTFTKAQQFGGCYLTNRITTKLHLHFPLPHYNDTVLYSKTNFYKSQPPQLPQQLGCAISQTGLPQNSISTSPSPHYNDTVLYFKTIFDKSQPPQYPRHLGGYLKKQGHHKTSPLLTMTSCYILKQIPTKANLLIPPTLGGGAFTQTGLPENSHPHFPPYNNVVLYSKRSFTNVNLLNSPNSWGWLSHKPDYHKTPPPLLTMMSCYILKQTSTKVNLLNSPQQKSQNMGSLGDNCSPPNFWSETQKNKTYKAKQTNKQKHKSFWWHHDHASPLPPPPLLTSSPSPNGDTILKLWCYLSNQTWKIQTLSVPTKNIMFSRKNRSLPQKLQ